VGNSEVAVIVGAGQGLSAALTRALTQQGTQVVLAARDVSKLSELVADTGARAVAMGKFALRGLAQSMARELAPQNIHVAHFVIDGGIRKPGSLDDDDRTLHGDAIAASYLAVHRQPRSAWTWEMELRPWVEKF
jgi:NAD(P)-dependent dehydrogenase (short-subunit alcohol dehydrogenase family)